MNILPCNDNFREEFEQYSELVLTRYGMSSEMAEREAIFLSNRGNPVAQMAYADLFFYGKIKDSEYRVKAFDLYLRSADMTIDESGELRCQGRGIPQSYAMVGYYFFNYRRDGRLIDCETIDAIEKYKNGEISERIKAALCLCASCLKYTKMPLAINLLGRILDEVSHSDELLAKMSEDINRLVVNGDFCGFDPYTDPVNTVCDCRKASEYFYIAAAESGYVYGCNSLATREADIIVELCTGEIDGGKSEHDVTGNISDEVKSHIEKYITYLDMASARYESYASNKLGLFYASGEVRGKKSNRIFCFKSYCDLSLAKKYFTNATIYPNKTSAWAYYNLIKYFNKEYNSDLELLNKHMECMKNLNPEVYSLAMEE